MKKPLTKMERERMKKKILHETEEELDLTGQESEKKAAPHIARQIKEQEKQIKKKRDDALNKADMNKKRVYEYRMIMLKFLHNLSQEIPWPKEYQWGVWFDGKGIRISIIDRFGKKYDRAFILVYDPQYDINACYNFAVWAEDILDGIETDFAVKKKKKWTPRTRLNS